MKVVLFGCFSVLVRMVQAIPWFPQEPEIAEQDIQCIDSDLCCQARYPDFVKQHFKARTLNPILSIGVRFYDLRTSKERAKYYCQHTLYSQPTLDKDHVPDYRKRRSTQAFILYCAKGESLDKTHRGDMWHRKIDKVNTGRIVAICKPPDGSQSTHVVPGSTVCENKVVVGTKRSRQVAELYEILELDPDEADAEPMTLSITQVGQPSTTQQGQEALQIEVEYDRVYRACAANQARNPGFGTFTWTVGASSSSFPL